ncbi:hypothetical protein IPF37_00175 [bacterium]|nr:MAG: hypothetical protein IPF37_00175 [bacterium]
MKFNRTLSLALVAAFMLAGNAFCVTSPLSKGKEINKFAQLAQAKIKEREHKLAQEYANAYADNYENMDQSDQQEALNQTKSFIEKAIKECKQSRIELVSDSIQAQLLGEIEEIIGNNAYQDLAKTLENAVAQKRTEMTSEDFFKLLNECSHFFTAHQSAEEQALMIPKLRLLIEHGTPLVKKEMSEENFEEQFLEPADLILQKITDHEIYKDLSATLEAFMPEAPELVEEKPSIATKFLTGIMLMSVAVGGFNLLVKIQDPSMHPPQQVEAVDVTEAINGTGDVAKIQVKDITTSSPSQDLETAVKEVVQVAEAEQPTPDVVKIDAINLMQQRTMNQTPTEFAQNQVATPQPSFFQSIRNLFTGYSSSFYDPVQHSGFDIKAVEETKQAEKETARIAHSQFLEAAKAQQYEQQRINELAEKVARDNAPSTVKKAWNSLISIFEEHTQAAIKTLEKLLAQDIKNTNKIEANLNETSSDDPEAITLKKELKESKNREEISRKELAALKQQLEEEKLLKKQAEQRETESQEKHKEEISQLNQQVEEEKQLREKAEKAVDPNFEALLKEAFPLRPEFSDKIAIVKTIERTSNGDYNVTIRTRHKWNPFSFWADETVTVFTPEQTAKALEWRDYHLVSKGADAYDWTSKPLGEIGAALTIVDQGMEKIGPAGMTALHSFITGVAVILGVERKAMMGLSALSFGFNVGKITVPLAIPVTHDLSKHYVVQPPTEE